VAYGGSAGGILMGAITNMRPDLFAGIIAAVPFVDVVNTMSDTSLPLTPPEWPEWGNPLEDEEAYDYIASYSPTTTSRPRPIRRCWPPAACPTRASPIGSPRSGSPSCGRHDQRQAGAAEDQHGRRPRRGLGRFDFLKEIALDYAFAVWAVDKGWEA
jgi:oligopeptidase B